MSRIIAYEEKAQIAADDYLVVDSSTDGTRKIKASLRGGDATYGVDAGKGVGINHGKSYILR